MSDFWTTSDGDDASKSDGSFESGGGFSLIPEDTRVLAVAEEAKNASWESDEYINIKWRVAKPEEYKNRIIFQKVKPWGEDPTKADKGKRMIAAIASNAGGGLFREMEKKKEPRPSDISLMQLCSRPMVLKLGIWMRSKDLRGNPIPKEQQEPGGNFVKEVSPVKGSEASAPPPKPAAKHAAVDFDSDIPF